MGVETVFLQGNSAHDKAIKIFTALGDLVKRTIPSFDVDNSLATFDVIMQGFLLKVAIADGRLANEELAYIKAVCNKADILYHLNQSLKGKLEVSWTSIKWMDKDAQNKLISLLEEIVNKLTENFVVPYALLDVIIDRDILADVKDAFLGIMAAFSLIDGDGDSFTEHVAIIGTLNVLENAWKKAMAQGIQNENASKLSSSSSAPAPQQNSLKAKYQSLKKN